MDRMIDLFRVRTAKDEAQRLIGECFDRGYTGQGILVDRFEREIAKVLGVDPECVLMVNSGTSAIQLALALCGVDPQHPGGEVVVAPATCSADGHAVLAMGGKVVWCDVEPMTGLMDSRDASKRITGRTRAVIGTDWGGCVPDVCGLYEYPMAVAPVPLIEDAAHRLTGPHWGDFVVLSLQSIKHLSCGDGGVLIVRNSKKAEEGRLRRWFSLDRRSNKDYRCQQDCVYPGYKFQATDLDAALALANLPLALDSVAKSRENARYYTDHLPTEVLIQWQETSPYWLYTIVVKDRDGFIRVMAENGIATSPVHARVDKHTVFRESRVPLPGLDHFDAHHVCIPNGFWVSPGDREKVAEAVRKWVER